LDDAKTLTSEQGLADAAARLTSEQRLSEGFWTTVDVLPENGEVHIAHGPAFDCFIGIGLCDCCTCTDCQESKASLPYCLDLVMSDGE
jgi:hypothetical protein